MCYSLTTKERIVGLGHVVIKPHNGSHHTFNYWFLGACYLIKNNLIYVLSKGNVLNRELQYSSILYGHGKRRQYDLNRYMDKTFARLRACKNQVV